MSEHLIPNDLIQWHFATLTEYPEAIEHLLGLGIVPNHVLASKGQVLTADQFAQLLKHSIALMNDETFGLLHQPVHRGSFHMMCHACISCTNLRQVIERCIKFYRVFNPQFDWDLVTEGETSYIEFTFKQLDKQKSGYLIAFISVVIWRWLSWMINQPIELDEVEFNFNAPVAEDNIEPIFKRRVKQNREKNRIGFANRYLTYPVKQTAQSLEAFLITVPECLLSHYRQDMTLSGQLHEYAKLQSNLNRLSLADAAKHFYCSEQSLIRRLKIEGTKFKKIVDQVQKKRARNLVLTSTLTNQQIALALGYTDTSVFYRKFKSWFQQTPNQYRATSSD